MHEFVEYTLENLNYPLLVDTVPEMVDEWLKRLYSDPTANKLLSQMSQTSRDTDTRSLMYLAHNVR